MLLSYSVAKRLFSSQFIYVLPEIDDTAERQYIADGHRISPEPTWLSPTVHLETVSLLGVTPTPLPSAEVESTQEHLTTMSIDALLKCKFERVQKSTRLHWRPGQVVDILFS